MPENLYLQPQLSVASSEWHWLLLDELSGVMRLQGSGSLQDLSSSITPLHFRGQVRVLLPGEEVLLTSARVPTRQPRQIIQAVPFLVEEEVAVDIDDVHLGIGPRDENGDVPVAVVDRERMNSLLAELAAVDISPSSLTSDVLCVPRYTDSDIDLILGSERVLIRSGAWEGVAAERALVSTMLHAVCARAEQEEEDEEDGHNIVRVYVEPGSNSAELDVNQVLAEVDGEQEAKVLDYDLFESCCRHYDTSPLNLLQGDFKIESKATRSSSVWRTAGWLAASVFVIHLGLLLGRGIYLDQQAISLGDEAQNLYTEIFPRDRNVSDLRRRWRSHLASEPGEGKGIFLELFGATVTSLGNPSLVLENINYNENRGDLILQMRADRSEQLVTLSQSLEGQGLEAEIGTISQDEDSVKGSIKISRTGGR